MKTVVVSLKSMSPYMQSRFYAPEVPKLAGEQPDAYEERTWKNKAHTTSDGTVFVPQMALSSVLQEAAKFMNKKIPGRRNETWTKHFESGIIVQKPMLLGINIKNVKKTTIHCSADGKAGATGGKSTRVIRHFPTVEEWKGTAEFIIFDDMITEEIFREVLVTAGNLIGIGSFRVRNRGFCGRFEIVSVKWG